MSTLWKVTLLALLLVAAAQADVSHRTVVSISSDPQLAGVNQLLPLSLRLKDEFGEFTNLYVSNNPEMSDLMANPQKYTGKEVKVTIEPVNLRLPGFDSEVNVSQVTHLELLSQSGEAGDQDADADSISGCQDDVLTVTIVKQTIPGAEISTTMMSISGVYRGQRQSGQVLEAFWDSAPPKPGDQYIIMGRVREDGFFHVDPQVRYLYTHDKLSWVQSQLK